MTKSEINKKFFAFLREKNLAHKFVVNYYINNKEPLSSYLNRVNIQHYISHAFPWLDVEEHWGVWASASNEWQVI